ncbi:MAG: helix-turn-helix transcriptional regulator [Candidatus Eisenbacteria bacterium]|nr:helix-turn-helix transcriptional regulator [Candidatus Eisenbacteria bacterium]
MKREPMLAGPIDLMVLAVVDRRPSHGYAILSALRLKSGGRLDLAEGTIYPALYRLEQAGYLASDARTVSGRSRRTYRLTRAGRTALRERRRAWRDLVASMDAIVHGAAGDHG